MNARLVAGVTEHDALIAGTLLLLGFTHDTLVDVGRLLVDGRNNTARIAVETVITLGVADLVDDATCHTLHIDIGLRAHLAGDDHETRRAEGFAGDLRIGVVAKEFVENGVGNLIRDLIGVSLGHRFRCKQKAHCYPFFRVKRIKWEKLAVGIKNVLF